MSDARPIQTGKQDFNIDAREALVIGSGQRIPPLQYEEISDEAKALCRDMRISVGAADPDHIPEVVATMLRAPELYRCQMDMGVVLASKGTLSMRERELAVLRTGWLCRAPYEWGQHVEIAKRYGIKPEEIERVTHGSSADGWSEHERAIISAVEQLIGDQSISDETWATLAKTWNPEQLMELPILVGAYFTTALQQNSLRMHLNPENTGLRHR